MTAEIVISNEQHSLVIPRSLIEKIVRFLLKKYAVNCKHLAIHFVTKKKITELHRKFFGLATATDCMSFPIDSPDKNGTCELLGDIFVCPSVAKEYAKRHNNDPRKEVILYVIHGLLHLLGYDDLSSAQKKQMRKQEKNCFDALKRNKIL